MKKPSVPVVRGLALKNSVMPGGASTEFAPHLGAGPNCVLGMAREKRRDAIFVLAGQDRAGRIDQPSALVQARGGLVEQSVLQRNAFPQDLRRKPPAQFGLAAPCAGAGAGCVDQHGVERPVGRFLFSQMCADDRRSGAPGARCEFLQDRLADVAGDDLALVLHHGRERERLSAGAGRKIEHALAGLRRTQ